MRYLEGLARLSRIVDGECLAETPLATALTDMKYLQSLEVGGVVQQQLARGHDDVGCYGLEGVDKSGTLLRDSLEGIAIGVTTRHELCGGLKECPGSEADLRASAFHAEEQSADSGDKRSRHGSARQDGEAAQRNGESGQDVPARRGHSGLEEHVIRGAE